MEPIYIFLILGGALLLITFIYILLLLIARFRMEQLTKKSPKITKLYDEMQHILDVENKLKNNNLFNNFQISISFEVKDKFDIKPIKFYIKNYFETEGKDKFVILEILNKKWMQLVILYSQFNRLKDDLLNEPSSFKNKNKAKKEEERIRRTVKKDITQGFYFGIDINVINNQDDSTYIQVAGDDYHKIILEILEEQNKKTNPNSDKTIPIKDLEMEMK